MHVSSEVWLDCDTNQAHITNGSPSGHGGVADRCYHAVLGTTGPAQFCLVSV